nr:hypothetical protein [Tanacetum cinerariifolium]
MREFKEYVEVIEVMDVQHSGLNFTWNQNPKRSDGILKKIDQIMSNIDFTDCFEGSHAIFKPYHVVKQEWVKHVSGFSMFKVAQKVKMLKRPLRKLLFDGGNLHDNVNRLRVELDQVQADLDADPNYIKLCEVETASIVAFNEAIILLESCVFVSYYVNFLREAGHTSGFDGEDMFQSRLADQDALNMVRPISHQEVKDAMFVMGNDKSPGPTVIRLLSLRRHGILWKRMSLIRFLNFLSMVLMHNYHLDRGTPRCAFKVDIQKAYDTVDWDFLQMILEALEEFTCAYGLVPSLSKRTAYFCNVVSHTKTAILQILLFEEGRLPIKYLGVPLVSSRLTYRDCKEVWCQGIMRKGKANVAWEDVCRPKKEGGLGLRRLDEFNKALMISHVWKLISLKESLWVQWIHEYKIRGQNFWDISFRGNMTWDREKFFNFVLLCMISYGTKSVMEFECLCGFIAGMICVLWLIISLLGISFMWASTCPLRSRGADVVWYDMVWFSNCIPRHALNMWLILLGRLKTQDKLRAWDLSTALSVSCPLCNSQPDSQEHLSFECGFSQQLWSQVKKFACMDNMVPMLNFIISYLSHIAQQRSTRCVIAKLVVADFTYFIW